MVAIYDHLQFQLGLIGTQNLLESFPIHFFWRVILLLISQVGLPALRDWIPDRVRDDGRRWAPPFPALSSGGESRAAGFWPFFRKGRKYSVHPVDPLVLWFFIIFFRIRLPGLKGLNRMNGDSSGVRCNRNKSEDGR